MRPPLVHYGSKAIDDVDEIARYIARDKFEVGRRFFEQFQRYAERLAVMPGMGAPRPLDLPGLEQMRSWPIKGFENYLIFSVPRSESGITVIRVLHGARDLDAVLRAD